MTLSRLGMNPIMHGEVDPYEPEPPADTPYYEAAIPSVSDP